METRLATASWANAAVVAEKYCFKAGRFWLGRSATGETLGYNDDRHVCLVAGTRGGKGTSQIVNNLAWWPGSAVIVDPKGENAPLTSARRGFGAAHIDGMGQFVQVLDPFNECAKVVDPRYRAQFNPFDAIDPKSEDAIDEAGLLADALIVIREGGETSWDEMARSLVRGLILHILTSPDYVGMRNFTTLRELIMRGEWVGVQVLEEENARRFQSQIMLSRLGKTGWDEKTASFIAEPVATDFDPVPVPSPYKLLFDLMKANPRCDGVIAGVGAMFGEMVATAPKQFMGVLQSAMRNTEFADSPGMKRVTEKSTFKLSELKTRREGMTVYLTLPSRYRRTHFRWLRMMLTLTINEMQKTKGKPACGHPVLFCLDEFAGLKRMEDIENAAAEIAGYGVKLYFVLQTLEQLKNVYKDNWETFLANAGLKVFFSIEDQFTRKYVSELAGEAEVIRQVRSSSLGTNVQENWNTGRSWGSSGGTSETINRNWSHGRGASGSTNWSHTDGKSRGTSGGGSFATTESTSVSFGPGGLFGSDVYKGSSGGTSISNSVNSGWNESENSSDTYGGNSGWTVNLSLGGGDAVGTTRTWTEGGNTSQGGGVGQSQTVTVSETVHVRPLLRPDEVARIFGRIDEKDSPHYPGLALVMVAGKAPFIVRRVNYYEDVGFLRCFDKHPDHPFPVPSSWFQQLDVESFCIWRKAARTETVASRGSLNPVKRCGPVKWLQKCGSGAQNSISMRRWTALSRKPMKGTLKKRTASLPLFGSSAFPARNKK